MSLQATLPIFNSIWTINTRVLLPVISPQIDEKLRTGSGHTVPARLSKCQKDVLDDALMQLMVSKVLPLSMAENQKFLRFVQLLDSRYYRNLCKYLPLGQVGLNKQCRPRSDTAECGI